MSNKKVTITLAGKDYTATLPLTLGQLEDMNVGIARPTSDDPQQEVKNNFTRNIDILLAALAPENPDLTDAAMRAMRCHNSEFTAAVSKVLDASGLISKRDPATGEAPAETAKAA